MFQKYCFCLPKKVSSTRLLTLLSLQAHLPLPLSDIPGILSILKKLKKSRLIITDQ